MIQPACMMSGTIDMIARTTMDKQCILTVKPKDSLGMNFALLDTILDNVDTATTRTVTISMWTWITKSTTEERGNKMGAKLQ